MREAVERADAMLVVGSSVQVYSAFRLVRAVAERRRARGTPALPKLLPALASRLVARRDADDAEVLIGHSF